MHQPQIFIGKKGRILNGDQTGHYIVIHDDSANTGGYLILTSPKKDFSGPGFDNWAETIDDVEKIMKGFDWKIEWLAVDDEHEKQRE